MHADVVNALHIVSSRRRQQRDLKSISDPGPRSWDKEAPAPYGKGFTGFSDFSYHTIMDDATIYDPVNTSVEGTHAFFIVRGDPRTYNLPPAPEVPTVYLKKSWRSSAIAAGLLLGGTLVAFLSDGARHDGRAR